MELHIKGHDTIGGLLKERYREFDVVLFTNSNCEIPRHIETRCKDLLHICVDDIDFQMKNKVLVTLEQIKEALAWVENREKLISCCHAGVSRSSAMAYLIASQRWDAKSALSVLRPLKHWPNRLIVHLGSQVLNNPAIWDSFVQWQLKTGGVDPSENGTWPANCSIL